MKIDFLIVGQGIAGSLVALELLSRGKRVLVVDRDEVTTASKVAAGIINPLAGASLHIPVGFTERLKTAKKFYWDFEEAHQIRLFHHTRVARLFKSAAERSNFATQLQRDEGELKEFHAPLHIDETTIPVPFGGIEVAGGGWLDVPLFLETTRLYLLERASYAIKRLESKDVEVSEKSIRWKNVTASAILFCEGWRGNQNHFFDWVPMHPAIGDILDLRLDGLDQEKRILNRAGWLLPLGKGQFRAGSTYRHELSEPGPSEKSKEEILDKVSRITTLVPEVTHHRAAIRPIIRQSQIFMGRHPSHYPVAFFNGLGSKGVLHGPHYARAFVDHLLHSAAIPQEADLQSNQFGR